jgi:hypothetical protein
MAPFHPHRSKFNTLSPLEKRLYGLRFTKFLRSMIGVLAMKPNIKPEKRPKALAIKGPTGKPLSQIRQSAMRAPRGKLSPSSLKYLVSIDGK